MASSRVQGSGALWRIRGDRRAFEAMRGPERVCLKALLPDRCGTEALGSLAINTAQATYSKVPRGYLPAVIVCGILPGSIDDDKKNSGRSRWLWLICHAGFVISSEIQGISATDRGECGSAGTWADSRLCTHSLEAHALSHCYVGENPADGIVETVA
jgi:hypothetical protein